MDPKAFLSWLSIGIPGCEFPFLFLETTTIDKVCEDFSARSMCLEQRVIIKTHYSGRCDIIRNLIAYP